MKWFFGPPFLSVSPFLLLNLARRQSYAYAIGLYTRPEIKSWPDLKFCAHAHCVLPRCSNIADEHWRLAWTLAPWAQFSVASEWRMPALLCVSSFSGYVYCAVLFDTGECLLYNIELISVSDSLGEWIRLLGGKFTSQVFGDLSDATPRAYTIYTSQVSFHFIHLTRWLACKDFQNVFSLFYFPDN